MTELVIYRGLPASGKTTHAKNWVAEDPAARARVNRDDLRLMHHGGYVDRETEKRVRIARDRLIKALLDQGVSVACDDTNLPQETVRDLARQAVYAGASVRVVDLTDVSLEECLRRDRERGEYGLGVSVGDDVIVSMHERFLKGRDHPLPLPTAATPDPVEPYVARPGTPRAVMVDLDGTLCLHNGRSPYDESRVHEDLPNRAVIAAIDAAMDDGIKIVFCSGRSGSCRAATEAWLDQHVLQLPEDRVLLMRAEGDKRRDSIVKREMFDAHIRDRYDVLFVLDDRQQVVDEWRRIGLTVFQVAPGDF